MTSLTRRAFVRDAVLTAAGLSLLGCGQATPDPATQDTMATTTPPLPYLDTIGLQLWTVREQFEADPRTTVQTLAEMGYRQLEAMDTRQLALLKPLCAEFGLSLHSSFLLWETVTQTWELTPDETKMEFSEVIDQAGEGGCSHLVFGYFQPGARQTADDWKRVADQINEAGRRSAEAGLQLAYHNHNFEWDPVDGTTGWDILLDRLDGNLVPFELDVFWAQIAGQDPAVVLADIKDRVELLHLKQLNPTAPTVTTLADVPPDAFEELPDGNIPIMDLMRQGQEYGVAYCMVEQDNNWEPDPLGSARRSLEFLRQ